MTYRPRTQAYISQGNRAPTALVRAAVNSGWGVLLSAAHDVAAPISPDYVIDNGAWTAHQTGGEWDRARFVALVVAELDEIEVK